MGDIAGVYSVLLGQRTIRDELQQQQNNLTQFQQALGIQNQGNFNGYQLGNNQGTLGNALTQDPQAAMQKVLAASTKKEKTNLEWLDSRINEMRIRL